MKPVLARRMAQIEPFRVMDILARARHLEREGRDIVHMEIGEPDFTAPQPVVAAGVRALQGGRTHYTPATGLPELRQAIAAWYRETWGITVAPERIVVTPGASGALLLVLGVLLDPGQQVLVTDPGYPCNRHFVRLLEGEAVSLPVGPETGYQPTADMIEAHWGPRTRAVLLASPANPTGSLLDEHVLADILACVTRRGGLLVMDEIYQGLVYEGPARSALALTDRVFVLNSFSKYFGMTGWRLGWVVAPDEYVEALDRLAQNVFLAAPTPSQHAALAAFGREALAECERRREILRRRRDFLRPALQDLGFAIDAAPQGAFYLYADCSAFTSDSAAFCRTLLEEAGVAVTPGCDFGNHRARYHVRFAYTTSLERLEEGVRRLAVHLQR